MNRLCLVSFLSFFCLLAAGQEKTFLISGKVSGNDWYTVSPLIHAYIQIKEEPKTGFLTDSSGYFKIDGLKSGKYHLTVSFVGFESYETVIRLKNKSIDSLRIVLPLYYDPKEVSARRARKEIKRGHPHLYACTEEEKHTAFKTFNDKYKVGFTIYNRKAIRNKQQHLNAPPEALIRYNRETFEYLDKAFGKSWYRETPPGIFGLENPIR